MAKKVIWSKRAVNDRKEILRYWNTYNGSTVYSKKLNALFKKAIHLIATHPFIGRKTDAENIRAKLVKDYLIIYKVTEARIEVLIVWNNRRNPDDLQKAISK